MASRNTTRTNPAQVTVPLYYSPEQWSHNTEMAVSPLSFRCVGLPLPSTAQKPARWRVDNVLAYAPLPLRSKKDERPMIEALRSGLEAQLGVAVVGLTFSKVMVV